MDSLPALLLIVAVTHFVSGLLAFKVGRWVERKAAETAMLRAQLDELKTAFSQADYAALLALREYQRTQSETARAKAILLKAAKGDPS